MEDNFAILFGSSQKLNYALKSIHLQLAKKMIHNLSWVFGAAGKKKGPASWKDKAGIIAALIVFQQSLHNEKTGLAWRKLSAVKYLAKKLHLQYTQM